MNISLPLAWFYWNPDPVAFVLPFLDIPILWYGILFVTGFIIGYFILQQLIKTQITKSTQLYIRDIINFSRFEDAIKTTEHTDPNFWKTISLNVKSSLLHKIRKRERVNQEEQQELVDAFNQAIQNTGKKFSRDALAHDYAGAIYTPKDVSTFFVDKATWFIIIGAIVGARLGHILFYDLYYYLEHPIQIFNLRQGGLASHGGTLGIFISLWLFNKLVLKKHPDISFLRLLDLLVIPTSLAVCFIRLGNFVNQEIIGTQTDVPWAIVFGNPANGGPVVARHPVQLYERPAYFFTFILISSIYRFKSLPKGKLTGLFFICIFGSRFFLEFFKVSQSHMMKEDVIQTGQLLSIPFILLGLILYFPSLQKKIFRYSS